MSEQSSEPTFVKPKWLPFMGDEAPGSGSLLRNLSSGELPLGICSDVWKHKILHFLIPRELLKLMRVCRFLFVEARKFLRVFECSLIRNRSFLSLLKTEKQSSHSEYQYSRKYFSRVIRDLFPSDLATLHLDAQQAIALLPCFVNCPIEEIHIRGTGTPALSSAFDFVAEHFGPRLRDLALNNITKDYRRGRRRGERLEDVQVSDESYCRIVSSATSCLKAFSFGCFLGRGGIVLEYPLPRHDVGQILASFSSEVSLVKFTLRACCRSTRDSIQAVCQIVRQSARTLRSFTWTSLQHPVGGGADLREALMQCPNLRELCLAGQEQLWTTLGLEDIECRITDESAKLLCSEGCRSRRTIRKIITHGPYYDPVYPSSRPPTKWITGAGLRLLGQACQGLQSLLIYLRKDCNDQMTTLSEEEILSAVPVQYRDRLSKVETEYWTAFSCGKEFQLRWEKKADEWH